jgi:hypothetical protein
MRLVVEMVNADFDDRVDLSFEESWRSCG